MNGYEIKYEVESFEIVGDFILKVKFEDGTSQTIDFWPVLGGAMFEPLRDLEFFNRVYISEGIRTLAWPNGADFNPNDLHDWPEHKEAWIQTAKRWEQQYRKRLQIKTLTNRERAALLVALKYYEQVLVKGSSPGDMDIEKTDPAINEFKPLNAAEVKKLRRTIKDVTISLSSTRKTAKMSKKLKGMVGRLK